MSGSPHGAGSLPEVGARLGWFSGTVARLADRYQRNRRALEPVLR
jgi:hypothetical protein